MSTSPEPEPAKTALLIWGAGAERRRLSEALKGLGFTTIVVAENAVEAFARLAVCAPDIVFVEARIRPVPGLVVIRELRATPLQHAAAPMVLWTNADADAFRGEADKAGVSALLEGAFEAQDVAAAARAVASARGRGDALPIFGPARRSAEGDQAPPPTESEGARATFDAALDRLERLAGNARASVSAWSRNGLEAELAFALSALDEASMLAVRCGDPQLLKSINTSMRAIDEIRRTWDADDRTILESIDAVMAQLRRHEAGEGPSTNAKHSALEADAGLERPNRHAERGQRA